MINTDWKFHKGKIKDAYAFELDDREWENVSIPHTWNNIDGRDGTVGGKKHSVSSAQGLKNKTELSKRLIVTAKIGENESLIENPYLTKSILMNLLKIILKKKKQPKF